MFSAGYIYPLPLVLQAMRSALPRGAPTISDYEKRIRGPKRRGPAGSPAGKPAQEPGQARKKPRREAPSAAAEGKAAPKAA